MTKPTIAELEHILAGGDGPQKIEMLPNGEIRAVPLRWQPWATAPKDGTWIIAVMNDRSTIERLSWGRDRSGVESWCTSDKSLGVGDGLFEPNGGWTLCPTFPEQQS